MRERAMKERERDDARESDERERKRQSSPLQQIIRTNPQRETKFLRVLSIFSVTEFSEPGVLAFGVSTTNTLTLYREREFCIENLLVRIHLIIVMIRWTGLAPWEFEFPFPGSLTSIFLELSTTAAEREGNNLKGSKDFPLKIGSSQDQNVASTVICVSYSLVSGKS